MPDEYEVASVFIEGLLKSDSTLVTLMPDVDGKARLYACQAPQNAVYPFVIWNWVSGVDLQVVGAFRIWTNALIDFQVIGARGQSFTSISPIFKRLDTLLHRADGLAAGGNMYSSTRENMFILPIEANGIYQPRQIGRFRFYVQAP